MKGLKIIMAKATELVYTEKELAAIEILRANRGVHLSAKELGIANGTLTSLMRKAEKFPEADGVVVVNKEDYVAKCPTCGAEIAHKLYWIN